MGGMGGGVQGVQPCEKGIIKRYRVGRRSVVRFSEHPCSQRALFLSRDSGLNLLFYFSVSIPGAFHSRIPLTAFSPVHAGYRINAQAQAVRIARLGGRAGLARLRIYPNRGGVGGQGWELSDLGWGGGGILEGYKPTLKGKPR